MVVTYSLQKRTSTHYRFMLWKHTSKKHFNAPMHSKKTSLLRALLLKLLWSYQKFFTLFSYGSCRYYPTCSEYARIHFENSPISTAFYHTFTRILRCNQLFEGGIDYPVLHKKRLCLSSLKPEQIKYWLVPKQNSRYYIIKNFSYKGSTCSKK